MKKIPLVNNIKFAIVDDEDYKWLSKYKWYLCRGYAIRSYIDPATKKQTTIRMHREIMKPPEKMEIDHINHNKLDNRKCNLLIVTHNQNQHNRKSNKNSSSQYKGVSWYKPSKKWRADICYNKKHIYLGHYTNEEEAARAYDKKAIELFGEFAYTNFPQRKSR